MKVYQTDKIINDVKIALDFNKSSADLTLELGDFDTLSVYEIIKSKITQAVRQVHCAAPVNMLDGGYNFGDCIHWTDNECGYIILPDDFMRFVVFEMDDWHRPVFSAITPDDSLYKLQSSRFKGVRGSCEKPVCAISWRPEGKVLEFFSCRNSDAKITRAAYIPYPEMDDNEGIEICEKCYEATVYMIASLVCGTLNENNKATFFNELSKSFLL